MLVRFVRTEEAKEIRRLTGTNPFNMKCMVFDAPDVIHTLCAAYSKDTLIAEINETY